MVRSCWLREEELGGKPGAESRGRLGAERRSRIEKARVLTVSVKLLDLWRKFQEASSQGHQGDQGVRPQGYGTLPRVHRKLQIRKLLSLESR